MNNNRYCSVRKILDIIKKALVIILILIFIPPLCPATVLGAKSPALISKRDIVFLRAQQEIPMRLCVVMNDHMWRRL